MIDSAAVRQGTSPLCPSCYADCRKTAETDKDGQFRIASVDPELLFNVLVVADGFQPKIAKKADPARAADRRGALASSTPTSSIPSASCAEWSSTPPASRLPERESRRGCFITDAFSGFSPDIFDPVAVTNLRGEFVLTSKSPITYADLMVEGNGVAPRIFAGRKPEANPQTIQMNAGATLTGRLVRDGKPVAGAEPWVRASESEPVPLRSWAMPRSARIRHGKFTFLNVHPDDDYFVYGMMRTHQGGGAVAAGRCGRGRRRDDGCRRSAGRGRPSDQRPGRALRRQTHPPQDASDGQPARRLGFGTSQSLTPTAVSRSRAYPPNVTRLNVSLRGYQISRKNHSIDEQSPFQLVGTIDQDSNR